MRQTGAHNNTSNNKKKKQDKHYENSFMMRGTERGLWSKPTSTPKLTSISVKYTQFQDKYPHGKYQISKC